MITNNVATRISALLLLGSVVSACSDKEPPTAVEHSTLERIDFDVGATASETDLVDQQQLVIRDYIGCFGPSEYPNGQTFTPTVDNITAFDVYGAGWGTYTVEIARVTDHWNFNAWPRLLTFSVNWDVGWGPEEEKHVQLPAPVPLVPGSEYAFLFVEGPILCLFYDHGAQYYDPYPGGMGVLWGEVITGRDLFFRTYYSPEPVLLVAAYTSGRFVSSDPATTASVPLEVGVERAGVPVANAAVFFDGVHIGETGTEGILSYRHELGAPSVGTRSATISALANGAEASTTVLLYESRLTKACVLTLTNDQVVYLDFVTDPLNFAIPHVTPVLAGRYALVHFLRTMLYFGVGLPSELPYRAGDVVGLGIYEYDAAGVQSAYAAREFINRDASTIYEKTYWTENAEGGAFDVQCPEAKIASNSLVGSLASPATMSITDPEGRFAGVDPRSGERQAEFPAFFTPSETHPSQFLVPFPSAGEYVITVTGSGEGNVELTLAGLDEAGHEYGAHTFAFPVSLGAEGEFSVLVNEDADVSQVAMVVGIDIKPGSDPNCFNNDGHGVIPVAILGSADFDATQVDPGSVRLEGLSVAARGKSNKLLAHIEDVNGDGFDDLVVQIEDVDGSFTSGSGTATLSGNLFPEYGGTPIQGSDNICVVP